MAYFDFSIPDDFIKQLGKLADVDRIAPQMLTEAIPILEKRFKDHIRTNHKESGDLLDSIKTFEPYQAKNGAWIVSSAPTGRAKKLARAAKVYRRSKHGRMTSGKAFYNADKLWFIENGNSRQPPRPFLTKIHKDVEGQVLNKMQEVFEREVGK